MGVLDSIRSHVLALPNLAKFGLAIATLLAFLRYRGGSRSLRLLAVAPWHRDWISWPRVFPLHPSVADFFADFGKLLLMFFAGLEIDVALFRRVRGNSVAFGLLTTSIPLALRTAVWLWFRYLPVAAVVKGSLLASHTLLALPIIAKLGAPRRHREWLESHSRIRGRVAFHDCGQSEGASTVRAAEFHLRAHILPKLGRRLLRST